MPSGVICGAIRFDAWYNWTNYSSVTYQEQGCIAPAAFQARAPWFTKIISPFAIQAHGTQANMDAECVYASNAGLKYWAFDSYQQSSGGAFFNADLSISWNLYQASPNNGLINWCWIASPGQWGSPTFSDNSWQPYLDILAAQLGQSTYQKVLSGRPLLYVLWSDAQIVTYFANNIANFATAVTYLRNKCAALGVGNPYIVIQMANAVNSAARCASAGADAISVYSTATATNITTAPEPWSALDAGAQAFWGAQLATGTPMIPCGITGWDLRPRYNHPESYDGIAPFIGNLLYFTLPTDAQVAAHLEAMVAFVNANPSGCPSGTALIYSYSECSEGGNPLIPTRGKPPIIGSPPTSSLLTAIAPVIK